MNDHIPRSKFWVQPRRARRSWRRVALIALLLVMGSFAIFLPNLVGIVIPNQLLAFVVHPLEGKLTAKTVSLGWLQPIVLQDVTAIDGNGEAVLEAREVRSEKSLFSLLTAPGDLGRFHVQYPKIHVVTWATGSNIERMLAPLLSGPPTDEPLDISWEVEGAEVDFRSPNQAQPVRWNVGRFEGHLIRSKTTRLNLFTSMSCIAGTEEGEIEIELTGGTSSDEGDIMSFKLDAREVPLAAWQPLLDRCANQAELRGRCTGRALVQMDLTRGTGRLEDLLFSTTDLSLVAPAILGDESLQAEQFELKGNFTWDPEQWQFTETRLDTDFGNVRLQGSTRPLTESSVASTTSLLAHILAHSLVKIDASVDLAHLTGILPQLTRRRDDVTIEEARLAVEVVSGAANRGGTRWQAEITTSDVRASRAGTPIVWSSPLAATLNGRWLVDHLEVEELTCRSDFLNASFEGTAEAGEVKAQADVHRLLAKATELFEVRDIDGGGEISGQLKWIHRKQQIEMDGRVWLDDFAWSYAGRPHWRETQLALHLAIKLQQDPDGSIAGIPSARFDLSAPAERVVAKLRRPVAAPWERAEWAWDLEASGRVERWKPRLQSLVDLTEIDMGGMIDLSGRCTVSPQRVDVESLDLNVEQLHFARQAIRVDEPQVVLQLSGEWSRLTGSWRSEQIQFQTSTVSASSADLQVLIHDPSLETTENKKEITSIAILAATGDSREGPPEVERATSIRIRGDLHFFSDLARLQGWFPTPQIRTNRVEGEVRGVARFATSESGSQLNLQMDVTPFRLLGWREPVVPRGAGVVGTWQPLWVEPKVTVRGEGELDMHGEKLSLANFRLTGEGISVRGEGTLEDLTGRMNSDFRGELQYDLQPLGDKLRNLSVQQLTMTGRQRQAFTLVGPLRRPTVLVDSPNGSPSPETIPTESLAIIPRELTGRAVFGWDAIEVMAFPIGNGQVVGHLKDARLQFSLVNIPVSGGRMSTSPYLDFTRPPAQLKVAPGPLMSDVQITPLMCRSWLQYVAPLVANATSAEGRFGLQLDNFSMPLGAAESASISGALVIQEARIGPGPLAQQVITVAESIPAILGRRIPGLSRQTERWLHLPAQVVAFDVQEQRVTHQQLEMRVGDVRLTTTGWVALDNTMSLTVQVWIRDEWLQRNPLLEGLRGQAISIPVGGSLARPQIDQRVLTDLGRQAVGSAVGSAAGGLLRDLFDRQRPR